MNAISLISRVFRRVPGYDPSEYLDEINTTYKECWDYILQLDDSFFTDIKVISTSTVASEFDFLYNSNGNLASALSPRYFEIDRIRILQPGNSRWSTAVARPWIDADLIGIEQLTPQNVSTADPYIYTAFAIGSIKFAMPLPAGTQIEVIYTFIWLPLTYLTNGNVTTIGGANNVTGSATSFTQVISPDFQQSLPGIDEDTDIGVELILNYVGPTQLPAPNQVYRVAAITTNTTLATVTNVANSQAGISYCLAMVPDIPEGHHNVISTMATANMIATLEAGETTMLQYWAGKAEKELNSMRDSVMTRQRQTPSRRQRFPQSVMRMTSTAAGR